MANVSAIRGARVIGLLDGGPYTGKEHCYVVPASDATALFEGDFVKSLGGSVTLSNGHTYPTVTQAAAGNAIRGVVTGFDPVTGVTDSNLNLTRRYRPASTQVVVWVNDDPNVLLEIQANGTTALADVGENADITVGTGDTATGFSGMELDSSTHTTSSAQLRILGFINRPGNAAGSANAKLIVKINEHELASTAGV